MSLADDQIINNDSYNALDEYGKRINKCKYVLEAVQATTEFDIELEKAKKKEKVEGKTVIDPEAKQKIDYEALVRGIKDEMERN